MDSTNIPSKPLPPGRGFHRSEEYDNPPPRKPLPGIIVLGISALVAFHFLAIGVHALAFQSGPWLTPLFETPMPADPPPFARIVDENISPWYLTNLRMTHNYHFDTNRTEVYDVYFEVRLKDARGNLIKTLKFPEDDVNWAVRHRQKLLAQSLLDDTPAVPPLTERVPSPQIYIWQAIEGESSQHKAVWALDQILEHKIPRNRPSMRPSEASVLLANAYVRYLCREYGAASGQLTRYSREPVPAMPSPDVINALPPDTFQAMEARFKEYTP